MSFYGDTLVLGYDDGELARSTALDPALVPIVVAYVADDDASTRRTWRVHARRPAP